MKPTLALELEVAKHETRNRSYIGSDWWQFTDGDAEVFRFDPARWPRMIVSYECYDAFKGICDSGWDAALLEKARADYPYLLAMQNGRPFISCERIRRIRGRVRQPENT